MSLQPNVASPFARCRLAWRTEMSLYFIKPVVWNGQGYRRPGGGKFATGYPAKYGFGHEEWNNSVDLSIEDRGETKHVFHTEDLGKQNLDGSAGDIFVFMVASYNGRQFLVSVAGKATAYFGNAHRKERLRLLAQIKTRSRFRSEAWRIASVKSAFDGNLAKFNQKWKDERHWFASWTCPADFYLGLAQPLELNPSQITGRKRLIGMYGSYQKIDRAIALRIIDRIPHNEDLRIVSNFRAACGSSETDAREDIEDIQSRRLSPTKRRALIDARLGQGRFRAMLDAKWNDACAVTGCTVREILRASHIRPWQASNDEQRLDTSNGILLTAHLDALFDAGLITFDDFGRIIRSPLFSDDGKPPLSVSGKLRTIPSAGTRKYLHYHRDVRFRASGRPPLSKAKG